MKPVADEEDRPGDRRGADRTPMIAPKTPATMCSAEMSAQRALGAADGACRWPGRGRRRGRSRAPVPRSSPTQTGSMPPSDARLPRAVERPGRPRSRARRRRRRRTGAAARPPRSGTRAARGLTGSTLPGRPGRAADTPEARAGTRRRLGGEHLVEDGLGLVLVGVLGKRELATPGSGGPWPASASRRRTGRAHARGATGRGRPRRP